MDGLGDGLFYIVDFMVTICGYVYRKGFTWIREFIVGVLLIPTGFTIMVF